MVIISYLAEIQIFKHKVKKSDRKQKTMSNLGIDVGSKLIKINNRIFTK